MKSVSQVYGLSVHQVQLYPQIHQEVTVHTHSGLNEVVFYSFVSPIPVRNETHCWRDVAYVL